jgi:hypothetical protein
MRWKVLLVLLAAAVVVSSAQALAQEQSGSIQGIVRDSSGGILPGVTVEARSPAVVGVTTVVTDGRGAYRFPALPPATYTLTANLQGFSPGQVEHVVLALGQLLSVNITLSVGGVAETVEVTGESPLIDVKQNAAFATIAEDLISRIPKGRDFTDILRNAPGAQAEGRAGGLQVDGASGSENRFIIDGMDTTNLQNGVSGKTMLIDFIQEVQVKSSGYNAEFGGATGGVVSVLTKSGGNQIRGGLGLYEENNRFRGSLDKRPSRGYSPWNSRVAQEGLISDESPWQYYSLVGDVGGPIFRDRMWFYGGNAYTKNDYNTTVRFVNEPGHPERRFDSYAWAYYPNYNVTTQLSNSMRLRITGSNQRNRSRGSRPSLQSVNRVFDGSGAGTCGAWADMAGVVLRGYSTSTVDLTNCVYDQEKMDNRYKRTGSDSRNDVISSNLDWIITPKFFINTTAGYFRTNTWTPDDFRGDALRHVFQSANSNSEMIRYGYPTVPTSFQQPSGFSDAISTSGTVRNIYKRLYVNANTTYFASLAGQHMFKAGMRFERFGNDVYLGYTHPNDQYLLGP